MQLFNYMADEEQPNQYEEPVTPVENTHLKPHERRRIITSLLRSSPAAFVLGAALTAGALSVADIQHIVQPTPRTAEASPSPRTIDVESNTENPLSFREKYVQMSWRHDVWDKGEDYGINLEFSDTPHVFEIKDFKGTTTYNRNTQKDEPIFNGEVIFRRSTQDVKYAQQVNDDIYNERPDTYKNLWPDFTPSTRLMPNEVKATYVVPVFGDSYKPDWISDWGADTNATFRNVDVKNNKGTVINGDVWWELTDASGQPVDPQGNLLAHIGNPSSSEAPYFLPGYYLELQDKYFGNGITTVTIQEPGATLPPPNPLP